MYIYGFHRASQALNESLARCPTLHQHYDRKELGKAWRNFASAFPNFADVRLGAAHPGELYATKGKHDEHVMTSGLQKRGLHIEPGASVIIDGSIIDDEFTFTIEGRAVSYKLHAETTEKLSAIADHVWASLDPVFDYTTDLMLRKQAGSRQST